jgi:TPR repeat protein
VTRALFATALLLFVVSLPASADIDVSALRSLPATSGQSAAPSRAGDEEAEGWYRQGLALDQAGSPPGQLREAAGWYLKAAERGHVEAQTSLAIMYSEGQGVGFDPLEAARWFRRAADAGNARAQYSLGLLYHQGDGVQRDFGEAIYWYESAARQGNANAMNNLAIMYGMGEGVTQSNPEAYAWFALAAENGDKNAAENRDLTAEEMTPEERRKGRERYEQLEKQLELE